MLQWYGVLFQLSTGLLLSSIWSKISWQISKRPCIAAKCNGVLPKLSFGFFSIADSMMSLHTDRWLGLTTNIFSLFLLWGKWMNPHWRDIILFCSIQQLPWSSLMSDWSGLSWGDTEPFMDPWPLTIHAFCIASGASAHRYLCRTGRKGPKTPS